ncbi:hypothetical protein [Cupriavidus basilensis]|uniref:hypothetical protein n=1 Tax=Cupriavidus basilensis TaxID=68895 RepID=UPI00157A9187|nr:hypothetical protein [Cupriavidus basilensis]NUA31305.1 hypothetical protein [Cupriavidus basilensis]
MTLIDDFLPHYDFRERHAALVHAPADIILDCVTRQRAQDDPLVRLAIGLRELPSRLMNRSSRPPLDLDDFTFLGREGDSGLAFGLTGAFWRADYGLLDIGSPEAFKATARMDVCQLVMSFNVDANTSGASMLSTETRVFCPTAAVRRRFAPYWYIIRPVSGLIRRRMLARVRRQAEILAKER